MGKDAIVPESQNMLPFGSPLHMDCCTELIGSLCANLLNFANVMQISHLDFSLFCFCVSGLAHTSNILAKKWVIEEEWNIFRFFFPTARRPWRFCLFVRENMLCLCGTPIYSGHMCPFPPYTSLQWVLSVMLMYSYCMGRGTLLVWFNSYYCTIVI